MSGSSGSRRITGQGTTRRITGHGTTRRTRAIRELEQAKREHPPTEATTTRFRLAMRRGAWQPAGEIVARWTWPSRLDGKQVAIDAAADLLIARGWVPEADRSWLVLCLDEAITNAMLHGNEGDPRLTVDIAVADDGRRWQLAVSDQGQGFEPSAVPDPEDPASLLLEHGRGIRLMKSWLNALTYWRGGATVVLTRKHSVKPT